VRVVIVGLFFSFLGAGRVLPPWIRACLDVS
jgi:hypothetical protein